MRAFGRLNGSSRAIPVMPFSDCRCNAFIVIIVSNDVSIAGIGELKLVRREPSYIYRCRAFALR